MIFGNRLKLSILIFLFSFIFIRIYHANSVFWIPQEGDDIGYLAYTEAFFTTKTLDWCKSRASIDPHTPSPSHAAYFCSSDGTNLLNKYTPGPALTLFPFHLLGAWLQQTNLFTPSTNVFVFWSVIGTFFVFLLGTLLLYDLTLKITQSEKSAFWLTSFFILGNPVLFYVFRRPLLAHAVEYFYLISVVYCLYQYFENRLSLRWLGLCGLASGMIAITRLNDALIIAITGLIILFKTTGKSSEKFKRYALYALSALIPILVFLYTYFLQTGTWIYQAQKYDSATTSSSLFYWSPWNLIRMFEFFFGTHWGGFWLSPFYFFSGWIILKNLKLISMWVQKNRVMSTLLGAIVLLHLNIMACYPSNGMSYGNRYILVYFYFLHIGAIFLLAQSKTFVVFQKNTKILLLALCAIGGLNIVNYESNSNHLTLTPGRLGDEGIYHPEWQNREMIRAPHYAMHSLRHSFSGKAFVNLGVSPLAAYPLLALNEVRPISFGPIKKALEYYQSPKRKIDHFEDLKLLIEYQTTMFCILVVFFLGSFAFQLRSRTRHART